MNKLKYIHLFLITVITICFVGCKSSSTVSTKHEYHLNREFRGAWIQCVNGQFMGMSTEAMQNDLIHQLDELKRDGINTIIFQVRAECDALYESDIEPWSRFLTGQQGKAPSPYWDPLEFMVEECHSRGMELHAWINPYRAKTKTTHQLSTSHIAITNPELCFRYDDLLILNPGIPENREYILKVVKDIVKRYDIDGLHIDDYFYPYPAPGNVIQDKVQYQQYGEDFSDINDWRRDNVNTFIREMNTTIHKIKPWVKFGVSPFGIYRNKSVSPNGSNTNGLANYDDLYADILLWVEEGWIDYNVPQLYWQIGHPVADYKELIHWWNDNAYNRPLIIGEDVERIVKYDQMQEKMQLERTLPNILGSCQWYSRVVVNNIGGYATKLRTDYFNDYAFNIEMPWLSDRRPDAPKKLKIITTEDGRVLFWTEPSGKKWDVEPVEYAVFKDGKLYGITQNTFIRIPAQKGSKKTEYAVCALNRLQHNGPFASIITK